MLIIQGDKVAEQIQNRIEHAVYLPGIRKKRVNERPEHVIRDGRFFVKLYGLSLVIIFLLSLFFY